MLQIFEGRCPELVRTLPALVFDEHKTEDCADGDDHAPDALRSAVVEFALALERVCNRSL